MVNVWGTGGVWVVFGVSVAVIDRAHIETAKANKLFFIYVLLMVCTRKSTTF